MQHASCYGVQDSLTVITDDSCPPAACNLHTAIALVSKMKAMGIEASCRQLVMQPAMALERRKQQQSQKQVPHTLSLVRLSHLSSASARRGFLFAEGCIRGLEHKPACISTWVVAFAFPRLSSTAHVPAQIAFAAWPPRRRLGTCGAKRRGDLPGWASLPADILLQVAALVPDADIHVMACASLSWRDVLNRDVRCMSFSWAARDPRHTQADAVSA